MGITSKKIEIDNKKCFFYECGNPDSILIQAIDEHDLEVLDSEVEKIRELTGKGFVLLAFLVNNWNADLSPWTAPAVFGNEDFGGMASATLEFIEKSLIPYLKEKYTGDKKWYIGGYSLSALFALWACYNIDIFDGAASASPSMWFPGFLEYARKSEIKTSKIYLSLGEKEEKTKNKIMATVGNNIRSYYDILKSDESKKSILEWNSGNHFVDSDIRTAKAFAWLLEK